MTCYRASKQINKFDFELGVEFTCKMPYHDAVTTRISALVWQVLNMYIDQRHSQRYFYNIGHSSIFRMHFGTTLSQYNRKGMATYLQSRWNRGQSGPLPPCFGRKVNRIPIWGGSLRPPNHYVLAASFKIPITSNPERQKFWS